eukprot:SAG11_NODE_2162_length_3729_cov_1.561433_2_plen_204_part_00
MASTQMARRLRRECGPLLIRLDRAQPCCPPCRRSLRSSSSLPSQADQCSPSRWPLRRPAPLHFPSPRPRGRPPGSERAAAARQRAPLPPPWCGCKSPPDPRVRPTQRRRHHHFWQEWTQIWRIPKATKNTHVWQFERHCGMPILALVPQVLQHSVLARERHICLLWPAVCANQSRCEQMRPWENICAHTSRAYLIASSATRIR